MERVCFHLQLIDSWSVPSSPRGELDFPGAPFSPIGSSDGCPFLLHASRPWHAGQCRDPNRHALYSRGSPLASAEDRQTTRISSYPRFHY